MFVRKGREVEKCTGSKWSRQLYKSTGRGIAPVKFFVRPLPTQLFPGQALQISAPQATLPLPLSFTAPCSSDVECCSISGSLLFLAPKSRGFWIPFFTCVEMLLPSKATVYPRSFSSLCLSQTLSPLSLHALFRTSVLSKLICYFFNMFCD